MTPSNIILVAFVLAIIGANRFPSAHAYYYAMTSPLQWNWFSWYHNNHNHNNNNNNQHHNSNSKNFAASDTPITATPYPPSSVFSRLPEIPKIATHLITGNHNNNHNYNLITAGRRNATTKYDMHENDRRWLSILWNSVMKISSQQQQQKQQNQQQQQQRQQQKEQQQQQEQQKQQQQQHRTTKIPSSPSEHFINVPNVERKFAPTTSTTTAATTTTTTTLMQNEITSPTMTTTIINNSTEKSIGFDENTTPTPTSAPTTTTTTTTAIRSAKIDDTDRDLETNNMSSDLFAKIILKSEEEKEKEEVEGKFTTTTAATSAEISTSSIFSSTPLSNTSEINEVYDEVKTIKVGSDDFEISNLPQLNDEVITTISATTEESINNNSNHQKEITTTDNPVIEWIRFSTTTRQTKMANIVGTKNRSPRIRLTYENEDERQEEEAKFATIATETAATTITTIPTATSAPMITTTTLPFTIITTSDSDDRSISIKEILRKSAKQTETTTAGKSDEADLKMIYPDISTSPTTTPTTEKSGKIYENLNSNANIVQPTTQSDVSIDADDTGEDRPHVPTSTQTNLDFIHQLIRLKQQRYRSEQNDKPNEKKQYKEEEDKNKVDEAFSVETTTTTTATTISNTTTTTQATPSSITERREEEEEEVEKEMETPITEIKSQSTISTAIVTDRPIVVGSSSPSDRIYFTYVDIAANNGAEILTESPPTQSSRSTTKSVERFDEIEHQDNRNHIITTTPVSTTTATTTETKERDSKMLPINYNYDPRLESHFQDIYLNAKNIFDNSGEFAPLYHQIESAASAGVGVQDYGSYQRLDSSWFVDLDRRDRRDTPVPDGH